MQFPAGFQNTSDVLIAEIQIGNRDAIGWLISAMLVAVAISVGAYLRRSARRKFATRDRIDAIFPKNTYGSWMSLTVGGLIVASIILLTLGLMDIRWGKTSREVPQKGIEVMFLLDVSRSMLAEDATPNRLERAKQMIRDMVSAMAGDRVGLVAFAGETRQIIPLTNHYEAFRQTLADVGPDSVRRGGSKLGDAIRAGGDGFLSKTTSQRVMVILTDGEDQESRPEELAKRLHDDQAIRIFTIGLGDMEKGMKIPKADQRGFVQYRGKPVVSKLNGEILQSVATASQGVYIPAGTKQVDMNAVYQRYIADIEKTDFDTATVDSYEARFQWFALPALLLLLIEAWWTSQPRPRSKSNRVAATILLFGLMPSNLVSAQSVAADFDSYNRGVASFREQELDTAIGLFKTSIASSDQRIAASSRYNLGTALIAKAKQSVEAGQTESVKETLNAAIQSLRSSLRLRPRWENARANLEQAVRLLDQLDQNSDDDSSQDASQSGDEQDSSEDSQEQDSNDESKQKENEQESKQQDDSENPEQDSENTEQDSENTEQDSGARFR